jgi:hypothetical protein
MESDNRSTTLATAPTLTRIIEVSHLPPTLWNATKRCLHIAPELAAKYCDRIAQQGLAHLVNDRDAQQGPTGGPSQDETDKHFAQQFDGSVVRAQLALLDPHEHVAHVADGLARLLAGGRIAILDIPSGAGALALSLLSTVAELRARGVLPRQPLDVILVGGELSGPARSYADDLFAVMSPSLAAQAIFVEHTQVSWDVCDRVSTTALLQLFMGRAANAEQRVVVVSNFSDFLGRSGKQREAEPQLQDIFRFCSSATVPAAAIWLEPHTNKAVGPGGALSWFVGAVKKKIAKFATVFFGGRATEESPVTETAATFVKPLTPHIIAPVRLAVVRFDLTQVSP